MCRIVKHLMFLDTLPSYGLPKRHPNCFELHTNCHPNCLNCRPTCRSVYRLGTTKSHVTHSNIAHVVAMDKGSQMHSDNLRMPKHVLKLSSSDTVRVWWVPILSRGKFHIEPLPSYFPGETPEGAELMVAKVHTALNVRFPGGRTPSVLFTDRGNGFYVSGTGTITPQYHAVLCQHGLRAFSTATHPSSPVRCKK